MDIDGYRWVMGVFRTRVRVSQRFHGLEDNLICKRYKLVSQRKGSCTETVKLERKTNRPYPYLCFF